MKPYVVALREGHAFGVLAAVTLPPAPAAPPPEPVPPDVLARLHPEELARAETLQGYRQVDFVGGRLAASAAIRMLGLRPAPVLSEPDGAPRCPRGVALSITHKRTLAVALAARADQGSIGVDLEDLLPDRRQIAPQILTAAERDEVSAMPPERQWNAIVLRFSLKEAVYKALAPRLGRYIGFQEASVSLEASGTAHVSLHLANGEPEPSLEARYLWLPGRVLTMVRARWAPPG